MRVNPIKSLLLVCLSLVTTLYADWDSQLREMAKLYRSHHRDQFMSSLTATCRYPDVFKKKSPVKVQEWEIPTSLMKKGILPVLTGLQRHPSGELKRAPLVF